MNNFILIGMPSCGKSTLGRLLAKELNYDRVTIDTRAVTEWWKECDGEKADIADVVVRIINESQTLTTIADVKATMPQASPLIEKLNLDIQNEQEKQ